MISEKQREYNRRYYKRHKEELDERTKQWYKDHPEWKKEYYQKNKEKIDASSKRWREKNKDKFIKLCQESRRRRVERLRADGVTNAWSVVIKGEEPKYASANSKKN